MPVYEYAGRCGHSFEQVQPIKDPPLTACPKCGTPVNRVISQSTFVLKGGGWFSK